MTFKGQNFIKHVKRGASHVRTLKVSEDSTSVVLFNPDKPSKSKTIKVKYITEIKSGAETDLFQKIKSKDKDLNGIPILHLIFNMIYLYGKVLLTKFS